MKNILSGAWYLDIHILYTCFRVRPSGALTLQASATVQRGPSAAAWVKTADVVGRSPAREGDWQRFTGAADGEQGRPGPVRPAVSPGGGCGPRLARVGQAPWTCHQQTTRDVSWWALARIPRCLSLPSTSLWTSSMHRKYQTYKKVEMKQLLHVNTIKIVVMGKVTD